MGIVVGTCGHEFTEEDGNGYTITIARYDREFNLCENTMVVCKKCYKWYKEKGLLLYDEHSMEK
jgi:hypothetical protein